MIQMCFLSRNFLSSTKYIGGHSDLVGGAISYASEELRYGLKRHQILMGTNIVSFTYIFF